MASGEIAELAQRVKDLGRRFGFGGVGMPGVAGTIPAEWILGEHVRVGSDSVILSRAFHAHVDAADPGGLSAGIEMVRRWERHWCAASDEALRSNHQRLRTAIEALL